MIIEGTGSIPVATSSKLKFSHPVIGSLYVNSGAHSIKWSYHLNTVQQQTIGGEVIQILSSFVGPITIAGEAIGYDVTDNFLPPGGLGYKTLESDPGLTPIDELEKIVAYFRDYMARAGGLVGDVNRRTELAILFEYPARGWSFYIQPTSFDGYRQDKEQVTVPWSVTAEVVSNNALDYFNGATMASFTDVLTSQYLQTFNKLGNTNPFINPALNYNGDLFAARLADNFQRLIAAWSTGTFNTAQFNSIFEGDKQFIRKDGKVFKLPDTYQELITGLGGTYLGPPDQKPAYTYLAGQVVGSGSSGGGTTTEPSPPPATGGDDSGGGTPSNAGTPCSSITTAAAIDNYLAGHKMAGQGAAFVAAGAKYGVNPAFLVGITGQESSYGDATPRTVGGGESYNPAGMSSGFAPQNPAAAGGRWATFSSWAEAINTMAAAISGRTNSNYYAAGRYSVADVYGKWCSSAEGPCPTGVILAAIDALGGSAGDTRCSNSGGAGGGGGGGTVKEYKCAFRGVGSLYPGRIDNGVDMAGTHGDPIYALGPATITYLNRDDNWGVEHPGGGRIAYTFTDGPAKGKTVFVAEYINIPAGLKVGDKVDSTTVIATFGGSGSPGSYSADGIETGWARGPGDPNPLAGSYGGWTALGKNFNDLIVSLGCKSGRIERGFVGPPLPDGWPTW